MKLSDYVIQHLLRTGIDHVFGISGGAAVHLFDSADRAPAMSTTFVTHEQSASIAADGYARISGKPGVAIVTSGPGATNLLTGVCCSYYDSVPTLMITGQVATGRLRNGRPVRQVGFQETDVLSIFESVTKYAEQLSSPDLIAELLNQATLTALEGRQGPVLIDLPDDLQRADIRTPAFSATDSNLVDQASHPDVNPILQRLVEAQRPLIIVGAGINASSSALAARRFLEQFPAPVLRTWAALDVVPEDWPTQFGTFGVYGNRLGNHIVQNADFILCIGTRLSQNMTGGILEAFAPNAHIAMVDIDAGEMDKFDGRGIVISDRLCCSADRFFEAASSATGVEWRPTVCSEWLGCIRSLQSLLPRWEDTRPGDPLTHVDATAFVNRLSAFTADDEVFVVDTGATLTWSCNYLDVKAGQRVISAWNFTPMGYALPAAIGVAAATNRPITVLIGDGGLQLCLSELATVSHYNIPLKIMLFNNGGHGIQRQTQDTWFDGNHIGVDPSSGLGFADFPRTVEGLGIPTLTIHRAREVDEQLKKAFDAKGPVLCNVLIAPDQRLYPVLKHGSHLDDQLPPLGSAQRELIRTTLADISE